MKILTLNLRHDADRWDNRFPLVISEILKTDPDIIAFQEVSLLIKQATLIVKELIMITGDHYKLFLASKWGAFPDEGIAFVTKLKVIEHQILNLPIGGRVAQCIRIRESGCLIDIVNTHLHHLPQNNELFRMEQTKYLLNWIFERKNQVSGTILVGDFNATPSSTTINIIKQKLISAFYAVHGEEPTLTFPTPLVDQGGVWHSARTIDYIFCTPTSFVMHDVQLAFTHAHTEDKSLFPSDHYGLFAELGLSIQCEYIECSQY